MTIDRRAAWEKLTDQERSYYCDVLARQAHEANKKYCESIGDTSQKPWDEAPEWARESARKGVLGVIEGNTPEQSHSCWLAEKERTGWKYGPVKDPEAKTHPCMVPYDQLPPEQQIKDHTFVSTVGSEFDALTDLLAGIRGALVR